MSGADSPAILEAYNKVRSDDSPTNFLVITYAESRGSELVLEGTGEGGLEELLSFMHDDKAQYGYVRMKHRDGKGSWMKSFVFITWIGRKTNTVRRARVLGRESGVVKAVWKDYCVAVDAEELEDLNEENIIGLCKGANNVD